MVVFGADHAFSLKAPKGWVLDNESAHQAMRALRPSLRVLWAGAATTTLSPRESMGIRVGASHETPDLETIVSATLALMQGDEPV